jgi:hypothetical protein
LDLEEGYGIHEGEVISAPYNDIFQILNWMTLSHEVSHGYYLRLSLEKWEAYNVNELIPSLKLKYGIQGKRFG